MDATMLTKVTNELEGLVHALDGEPPADRVDGVRRRAIDLIDRVIADLVPREVIDARSVAMVEAQRFSSLGGI